MNNKNKISWFNPSNYSNLDSLSLDQWCSEIQLRYVTTSLLFSRDWRGSDDTDGSMKRVFLEHWENIRKYGLWIYFPEEEINKVNNDYLNVLKNIRKNQTQLFVEFASVTDITEWDCIHEVMYRSDIDEVKRHLEEYDQLEQTWWSHYEKGNIGPLERREEITYRYEKPVTTDDRGVIEIDLNASDEQIKDEFSLWLSKQRERQNRPNGAKRITSKDIADWVDSKILQYFDLITLNKLDGNTVSNQIIGDALFPNDIEVTISERVRKVIKPKAERVFSKETIDRLFAQRKPTFGI